MDLSSIYLPCCWRLWLALFILLFLTLVQDANELSGTIPTEIGLLSELTFLDLGKLSCIDWLVVLLFDYLFLSSVLVVLPLLHLIQDSANLSGTILTEIGMLSQLMMLDFCMSFVFTKWSYFWCLSVPHVALVILLLWLRYKPTMI